jgi:hypothetical protein
VGSVLTTTPYFHSRCSRRIKLSHPCVPLKSLTQRFESARRLVVRRRVLDDRPPAPMPRVVMSLCDSRCSGHLRRVVALMPSLVGREAGRSLAGCGNGSIAPDPVG